MILLTLSRGNEHERVHLRLPASPAEIGEAFVILDGITPAPISHWRETSRNRWTMAISMDAWTISSD